MTNTIPPFSAIPSPADLTTAMAPPAPAAAFVNTTAAAPENDSVTLSDAAQTTTQLLGAAQDSDGIDQTAVAQIRNALQAGTYNVTPEDLAQAIATVLKETN